MTAVTSGASALGKSIVHLRVQGANDASNGASSPGAAPAADHYSYSRLHRYATCPLSFKVHYLDGLSSEPAVELQFGTVIHRALESLIREHVRSNRTNRIDADDAVRDHSRTGCPGR